MKLIIRSMIAVLFLIALAMPSLAQSLAIRISTPGAGSGCFPVTVKNLGTSAISLNAAYLVMYDQNTCKVSCKFKLPLGQKLGPCKTMTFKVCCSKPFPSKHIAYVRVNHSAGNNEQWYHRP